MGENETHEQGTIKSKRGVVVSCYRRQPPRSPSPRHCGGEGGMEGGRRKRKRCRSRGSVLLNFLPASLALLPRRCRTFIFDPTDGREGGIAACGCSRDNKKKFFWTLPAKEAFCTSFTNKPCGQHQSGKTHARTHGQLNVRIQIHIN